ncbi:MAG TPA: T9SS type A sorting domain-containing protein [Bacteroidota bacterium]|nr:T9SS type A sorting domain-containing protein [Bacteroidota bacterium]
MRNRTNLGGQRPLMVLLVLVWTVSFAAGQPDRSKSGKNTIAKGTTGLTWAVLNINNLWTWHRSDGDGNHSPFGKEGLVYPAFTAHAVYEDNIVFGGLMYTGGFPGAGGTPVANQFVRVNGGTYNSIHGMTQGWVEGNGATAAWTQTVNDPRARIYRIRRDYTEMTSAELVRDASIVNELSSAAVATQAMVDEMLARYAMDWAEWPAGNYTATTGTAVINLGAPYIDRNHNGVYDPPPAFSATFTVDSLIAGNHDEPGVAGSNPHIPADQVLYTVYHGLDRTKVLQFAGSEPIGLEVQKTVWGYERTDALGNVYFTRYRLINKGGVELTPGGAKGTFYLDSMFFCQWSDIDIGNAGDDLIGCDSLLSLGYSYNGNLADLQYANYFLAPPSVGYDLLAGPSTPAPGDSGVFDLKRRSGIKNLGMSSFAYFSSGSPFSDPPFGEYDRGTGRWWAMLRGYAPVGSLLDVPTPYPHPIGEPVTKYPFSGDPVAGTGFVDGMGTTYSYAPGDRRQLVNSGPFRMAPGDTQEVYVAVIAGLGADRLSSVALMKVIDNGVQSEFNSLFLQSQIAHTSIVSYPDSATTELAIRITPPQNITVQSAELYFEPSRNTEPQLSLTLYDDGTHQDSLSGDGIWGNALNTSNKAGPYKAKLVLQTSTGPLTYDPYMSNVSLRPRPILTNWEIIWEDGKQDLMINPNENVLVRFDIHNADGLNSIIQLRVRSLSPVQYESGRIVDLIADMMPGTEIWPGTTSSQDFFVLSFRNESPNETAMLAYSVLYDGAAYVSSAEFPVAAWTPGETWRDTLKVYQVAGPSESVVPIIADPAQLTGHNYIVTFDSVGAELCWSLKDITTDSLLLTNQKVWPGGVTWFHPVVDGIQFIVQGIRKDIEDFRHVQNPSGPIDPPTYAAFAFNSSGFPTTLEGNPDRPAADWGGGQWGIHTNPDPADISYTRFRSRVFRNDNFSRFVHYDFEIRFTAGPNRACLYYTNDKFVNVPFELWNIGIGTLNDPSDDYRMIPWILDEDGNDAFNLQAADHTISGGDNDAYTDWIYWMDANPKTPGQAAYNAFAADSVNYATGYYTGTGSEVMARMVLVAYNSGSVTDPGWPANVMGGTMPATGNVIRILSSKPNFPGDTVKVWGSILAGIEGQSEVPLTFDLSQNYPNPFNPMTVIGYQIPKKGRVTIEIFDMLGRKIKTLVNQDLIAGSHSVEWDGTTSAGLVASSGVYFYRLTAPGNATTRKMLLLR